MRPLVPRGWQTTRAIHDAKKTILVVVKPRLGKPIPAFNGSQNNRNRKKRPITLPEKA